MSKTYHRTEDLIVRTVAGDPETFGIALYFEADGDTYFYSIEQEGKGGRYFVGLYDWGGDQITAYESYETLDEALKFVLESHREIVGDIFGIRLP